MTGSEHGDPQDRAHDGLRLMGVTVIRGGRPVLDALDLDVPARTLTVLVGPSGAGKTTLLRVVAGLHDPDRGAVRLAGSPLDRVPAHRRGIGMVFQEPRLLPHLDAAANVALPLRARGVHRRDRHARALTFLAEVGLAEQAGRRPAQLSGGERQRVALARALAARPRLLLLDEPLAAVDPDRREDLRTLLRRVQLAYGLTAVYVTHDRAEAAALGDRVAVLLGGCVAQHDRPRTVFERPVSVAVARFLGSPNLLTGTVTNGRLHVAGAALPVPGPDGPATLTIRPEHVRLDPAGPLRLQVHAAVYTGTHVRLDLTDGPGPAGPGRVRLLVHVLPGDAPAPGAVVRVDLPAARLWRLPEPAATVTSAPATEEFP